MARTKVLKQDRIEELKQELEMLQDELDSNDLEQSTLRSLARGLEEQVSKVEQELDELGADYE